MSLSFANYRSIFDLEARKRDLRSLEKELDDPEIWKDQKKANELSRDLKSLREIIGPYLRSKEKYDSVKELSSIVEKDDTESVKSLLEELRQIRKQLDRIEFRCLLGGPFDAKNAIVSINSGAGGTESCDWAAMLMRMYLRWAEKTCRSFEMIDQTPGDEAGMKSATFIVKGDLAYGNLKAEKGVHRLVRISPFDSNQRRHTSFASVDVIPELDNDFDVEINESDLRIDTYRASGAGGQHVNVTDSAVRITHIPTNIVAQCQNERSQHKNKATAYKILKAKLYEKKMREQEEKAMREHSSKKRIEWGSQIRSYVLHPYKMVKDHRTEKQTSGAEQVLDGDLDDFIADYLKMKAKEN